MIFTSLGLGRFAFSFKAFERLFSLIPLKSHTTVLWGDSEETDSLSPFDYSASGLWGGTSNNCNLTIITIRVQITFFFFFLLESNDHKRGAFSIACWIKICSLLKLFCEHCSSSGLRRTFKVFVLFENVKLLESSFILFVFFCFFFFFVMDTHFETSQCRCHNWLNVTAYHNAPWHYKMLRFIFMTVFHWYICICILNCTVKPCQPGEA